MTGGEFSQLGSFVLMSILLLKPWQPAFASGPADADPPADAPSGKANVKGRITYRGKVPLSRTANDVGTRVPLLTADAKGHGWQDVVVYVEPLGDSGAPKPEKPANQKQPEGAVALIDQRGMTFVPHLIAVRHEEKVRFTNSDSANHNVRASALDPRNQFNVFTGAGGSYDHCFQANARRYPVLVGCDIHAWMRAWIYVFDHSHFAVTSFRGEYQIKGILPGRYSLEIRQPDAGLKLTRELSLSADETKELDFDFREQDLKLD